MDTQSIYHAIIDRTIELMLKAPESTAVRRDVVDAIKRKWGQGLDRVGESSASPTRRHADSDPSVVDRTKYMLNVSIPVPDAIVPQTDDSPADVVEDEFADEFGDAEFVHATEVGRKLAESATLAAVPKQASAAVPNVPRRVQVSQVKELINPEELDDSLADPEYDNIPEPSYCDVRIFGQTEVCESIVGPRRSDSQWMVTVLNGFVKTGNGSEELLFRTANPTMPHLHQHI